ncbi:MAG: arginine deiminase [Spirochaetales bacterium]|nr:arginine deiminase [Spirochaetales bacterium]
MMQHSIHVSSEIGALRAVLLHRPGSELESLTPRYLDSMLFEDIPFLAQMQEEHDQFARVLTDHGCLVYYVSDLLKEVLEYPQLQKQAIDYLIESSHIVSPDLGHIIREHLEGYSPGELASCCIAGLRKAQVDPKIKKKTLSYYIRDAYPYYISPLPNLYFTRDPATVVKDGISINLMKTEARRRERWIMSMITKTHPLFASVPIHADYSANSSIEGGDILMLSESCAIVGSSARTEVWAIEAFARTMMAPKESKGEGLDQVLVIQIPYTRAYMHLDTVFTMVDRDAFCMYGGIEASVKVFSITKGRRDTLNIHEEPNLRSALKKALSVPSVRIIRASGDDAIAADREQWNDSNNTLAIDCGTVITYRRNIISNETLEKNGVTVIPIQGSELVRGRGGPRCMSMPLCRDQI